MTTGGKISEELSLTDVTETGLVSSSFSSSSTASCKRSIELCVPIKTVENTVVS